MLAALFVLKNVNKYNFTHCFGQLFFGVEGVGKNLNLNRESRRSEGPLNMILNCTKKFLLNACKLVLNDTRRYCLDVGIAIPEKELNIIQPDVIQKVLKVAIIGIPNSGKSTLINVLTDRKICPVSSKVHTTRTRATAIFTQDDTQIVFVDTPGLVSEKELKRMNLGRSFQRDVRRSLQEADVIGVIHDAGNSWTRERLDIKAIKALEHGRNKRSVLILNKIDMLKSKRKLLDLARLLTEGCLNSVPMAAIKYKGENSVQQIEKSDSRGWPNFSEIFMISALTGSGVDHIRDYFINNAKPGEWPFPAEIYSDQLSEQLILNTVKATLLNYLQQEIPYSLIPIMEYFDIKPDGSVKTVVNVKCPTDRIKRLVAGVSDGRLKQIMSSAQMDLQSAMNVRVSIQIVLLSPDCSSLKQKL